jgi:hypothetical protein
MRIGICTRELVKSQSVLSMKLPRTNVEFSEYNLCHPYHVVLILKS